LLEKTLARASRVIEKSNKFVTKIKSRDAACITRTKLIPENATIRKEYVKCKKPTVIMISMVLTTTFTGKI
jgi:hypothetical protein